MAGFSRNGWPAWPEYAIYRTFDSVRFAMMREGLGIKHTDIAGLYRASREGEFYFPAQISKKLVEYYDTCFELAELNGKLHLRTHLTAAEKDKLRTEQDLMSDKERQLLIPA